MLCLQLCFSRVLWAIWVGCILGMVHRWSTTDGCHGADVVRARRNNTLPVPFLCPRRTFSPELVVGRPLDPFLAAPPV